MFKPMPSSVPNTARSPERVLIQTFARLDRGAFGLAVGLWFGLGIFTATIVLLIKGGSVVGPTLGLLSQYIIGYSVTWGGSLVGLVYGFACGFCFGWLVAFLRNLFLSLYLQSVRFKAAISAVTDFVHKE
jgi:hypothetical protein